MRAIAAIAAFAAIAGGYGVAAHADARPPSSGSAPVAVVSRDDCRRLVNHQPDPGVAYKPGVDVRGKPVAPADLAAIDQNAVPSQITIDLQTLLGQLPLTNAPASLGNSYVHQGQVSIDLATGAVTLNGQKVGENAAATVVEACRKAGVR
jgi:hypothetical protein